ncbi:MAG: serine peptidase [Gammaproteobacteria bacterium]|nr:MAG: serine peptidase [Gammaproteobacteria bacterium]
MQTKKTAYFFIAGLLALQATVAAHAEKLPNFTKLIKDNASAVVQIESRSGIKNTRSRDRHALPNPNTPEDLFRYFFEGPNGMFDQMPQRRRSESHGSGFFIDEDGYILTNAHVVKDSDEITVSTTENQEYPAKLIGIDERTDVALLKIKKKTIHPVKIGDSDEVEVGNWVLAIGSPFGFDYTATSGIVSAVSRSLPDGTYVPFIQTDAAVNPGNSGGPLFNLDGEVIGINSQIYSNTGSFNGLAFAIPINTAMNIVNQIKSKGFVSRGWLGVAIQNVSQDLAKSFKLDKPMGALISSVVEDSPAEKAGLKVGDIILTFNGKKIKKSSSLPPMVGNVTVGKTVEVGILRNGKEQIIDVTIGELDEGNHQATKLQHGKSNNKGLIIGSLTAEQKRQTNVNHGVVVTDVIPNSAADNAGLRTGDIIVNIDSQRIDNPDDFNKVMKKVDEDKMIAVLIIRQGRSLFVAL